jgi:hypothetical protein
VTDGVMVGILLGEGSELYIVTDGVMVRILLGEGSLTQYDPDHSPSVTIYNSHTSLLSRHWAPSQYVHIGLPDDGILKYRNM